MARYSNCPQSYEIFSDFMKNCLLKDQSLIWPEKNSWTLENLKKIKENFIDNPIEGGEFWNKLFKQFEELNDDCWRILADALFVYTLPSSYMKPEKKYEYVNKVCEQRNFELSDFKDEMWDVLNQGFSRTAIQYHQKYKQLWLLLLFAIKVKEKKNREKFLNNHLEVREELYNIIENINPSDRAYGMLNAILHLGYPEEYERILSLGNKKKITEYYPERIKNKTDDNLNVDQKLLAIRKNFKENEYNDKEFDFYAPQIQQQWKNDEKGGNDDSDQIIEEDPFLDELVKTLRNKKQIILYGPPGTGKTYYAKKLARAIISQDNFEKDYTQLTKTERENLQLGATKNTNNSQKYLRFCTFHPAYGYEEFMEGYRPALSETGKAVFELQDGIFKKICKDAKKNQDQTYVLIIDEINRGDIPRIFGELITLLEADKRWSKNNQEDYISLTLPASQENFTVPENVNIIATMNTADKSIALLDIALRRRFGFRELLPKPELLENQDIADINLANLLTELNSSIIEKIDKNLQIGHSYLMKNEKAIKTEEQLISRIKDEILPLLQEYCFDDFSTLEEILGPKLVNLEQGRFNEEIFSSAGRELILDSLKRILAEESTNE